MLLDGKCCFVYIANKIMVCVKVLCQLGNICVYFPMVFLFKGNKTAQQLFRHQVCL